MTDAPADTKAAPAPPCSEAADPPLHQRIGQLAAVLGTDHFPAGDRAALKRMAPSSAPPLAFYRLWLRHLGDDVPVPDQTPAWTVIVAGLAGAPPRAHQPGRGLGQALAESGWHEARLERLLAAADAQQAKLAADALRFLAARGERFDWTLLARLLLSRAGDARDAIHRQIATDFYRHQLRPDTKE
ncbi:MAG: type I-E CRISPR-associated protein Cse2/CasB [Gammaproteobacteria bacterium]